ncbi:MAG: hypothetical protein CMQ51_06355 [Gammaproteobacteria bacterium]|nr:hypothetical protein [Gammaproteobacteria bacterium]
MKTITFVRHAQSIWSNNLSKDHDRVLSNKGEEDAYNAAYRFSLNEIEIDLIITSSAIRAKKTAEIFSSTIKYPIDEIIINKSLYLADKYMIIKELTAQDKIKNNIMIFGHNPGFTNIVNYFLDSKNIIDLTTSAIITFELYLDSWEEIDICKKNIIFTTEESYLL